MSPQFIFAYLGMLPITGQRRRMGGLNLQVTSESLHCSVRHACDTNGRDGGTAAQQREKQTGLQGDCGDFWEWNQCAYYESGRLNRMEDESGVCWSTVIAGNLTTLVSAQNTLYNVSDRCWSVADDWKTRSNKDCWYWFKLKRNTQHK